MLEKLKIYLCIKGIKIITEMPNKWTMHEQRVKNAALLIYAQKFRDQYINEDLLVEIINNPFEFDYFTLMEAYKNLEKLKNIINFQIKHRKQIWVSLVGEIPRKTSWHADLAVKGIEVWMCTLGAAISPKRINDVVSIWEIFESSRGDIPIAIKDIRESSDLLLSLNSKGVETDNLDFFSLEDISEKKIQESCLFIPSGFRRLLKSK